MGRDRFKFIVRRFERVSELEKKLSASLRAQNSQMINQKGGRAKTVYGTKRIYGEEEGIERTGEVFSPHIYVRSTCGDYWNAPVHKIRTIDFRKLTLPVPTLATSCRHFGYFSFFPFPFLPSVSSPIFADRSSSSDD